MAEQDINVVGLSGAKSGFKPNWKVISAIVGIIVLALGIIAGILLVRQNQDIREQAACTAQCPSSGGELVNCYNTADTDGEVSLCNSAGRIEICGQNASTAREYCCPSAGGSWTTNMTLCSVATATPTATSTATSTSSATATATATATGTGTNLTTKTATPTATSTSSSSVTPTAVSQATATAFPVPETGADWPTVFGVGFGAVLLFVSIFLAL